MEFFPGDINAVYLTLYLPKLSCCTIFLIIVLENHTRKTNCYFL